LKGAVQLTLIDVLVELTLVGVGTASGLVAAMIEIAVDKALLPMLFLA
jgi:hypothetical protein